MGLEFLSCYLGVAASHGYFGAVAVFSTSLLSLLLFHAPTPVRLSYLALHWRSCCPSAVSFLLLLIRRDSWWSTAWVARYSRQSSWGPCYRISSLSLAMLQFLATSAPVPALLGCLVWRSAWGVSSCPICSIQLQFPSRLLLLMPLSNVTTLWPD